MGIPPYAYLPYLLIGVIHYAILTILTYGIPLCHTYHTYLWDSTFIAPWLVTDRLRNLIYAQLNASNLHVRCQFKRIDRAQGEYKVVQIQYTYLLTYLLNSLLPSFLPSTFLTYLLTYLLALQLSVVRFQRVGGSASAHQYYNNIIILNQNIRIS